MFSNLSTLKLRNLITCAQYHCIWPPQICPHTQPITSCSAGSQEGESHMPRCLALCVSLALCTFSAHTHTPSRCFSCPPCLSSLPPMHDDDTTLPATDDNVHCGFYKQYYVTCTSMEGTCVIVSPKTWTTYYVYSPCLGAYNVYVVIL